MTSSSKWLSSFIFTYISGYGVSPVKYSFNFTHKSVVVICSSFSAQYLTICVKAFSPSYIFRSAFLNTSSLHFSRATEGYWNAFWLLFFALKLMSHWLWYNASAHGFCPLVLWPSSEHDCASFS